MSDRSGLKWVKVKRFFALMANPERGKTFMAVSRFEDIPIDRLRAENVSGVLVDADGTLGPHHAPRYPDSAIQHLKAMEEAGIRVAIFTNDREDRFDQFGGIPVVSGVAAKPSTRGFLEAMRRFLQIENPAEVCMIGDNYITDGGAIEAGMRFIYVQPLPGGENLIHRWTRDLAAWRARSGQTP